MNAILAGIIKGIRVESALTPAFTISDPFAESPPSPVASALGRLVRPQVTLILANGTEYPVAPYGAPTRPLWPFLFGGAALLLAVSLLRKGG